MRRSKVEVTVVFRIGDFGDIKIETDPTPMTLDVPTLRPIVDALLSSNEYLELMIYEPNKYGYIATLSFNPAGWKVRLWDGRWWVMSFEKAVAYVQRAERIARRSRGSDKSKPAE